jgi:hypothetical protein
MTDCGIDAGGRKFFSPHGKTLRHKLSLGTVKSCFIIDFTMA